MSLGNFSEIDSPESGEISNPESCDSFDECESDKLESNPDISAPDCSYDMEPSEQDKLDTDNNMMDGENLKEDNDSDNNYSFEHPDEGNRPEGDFCYRHPDEEDRPEGDFGYHHPDEGGHPEGDFSYKPENNLDRDDYGDDDSGGESPYTLKRTR